jgi:hypothetical protein
MRRSGCRRVPRGAGIADAASATVALWAGTRATARRRASREHGHWEGSPHDRRKQAGEVRVAAARSRAAAPCGMFTGQPDGGNAGLLSSCAAMLMLISGN